MILQPLVPADGALPGPWIGLLLIDATAHRQGLGAAVAALVEERFRAAGRDGVRIAVLDNNPRALAFWRAQGYTVLRHGEDRELKRPCTVLRKAL
ncbi:GNAT family N-acetyltransferase [Streptomyces goshikiensis]|uniref:GNAT family N-acetyltransferase n=1 Tax=Streptomyces goshikiensis TaxID=1942 RepID=UPI002E2A5F96|nr:GNAT family N-acetyltransferase [Streptomyces goshikiensis]